MRRHVRRLLSIPVFYFAAGFTLGSLRQRRRDRRIQDELCRHMAEEYLDLLRWMPNDVLVRYGAAKEGRAS